MLGTEGQLDNALELFTVLKSTKNADSVVVKVEFL